MPLDERDPQVDLVRRYARILRAAPAEAWRPRATPPATPATLPRLGRPVAVPTRRTRRPDRAGAGTTA